MRYLCVFLDFNTFKADIAYVNAFGLNISDHPR